MQLSNSFASSTEWILHSATFSVDIAGERGDARGELGRVSLDWRSATSLWRCPPICCNSGAQPSQSGLTTALSTLLEERGLPGQKGQDEARCSWQALPFLLFVL